MGMDYARRSRLAWRALRASAIRRHYAPSGLMARAVGMDYAPCAHIMRRAAGQLT